MAQQLFFTPILDKLVSLVRLLKRRHYSFFYFSPNFSIGIKLKKAGARCNFIFCFQESFLEANIGRVIPLVFTHGRDIKQCFMKTLTSPPQQVQVWRYVYCIGQLIRWPGLGSFFGKSNFIFYTCTPVRSIQSSPTFDQVPLIRVLNNSQRDSV